MNARPSASLTVDRLEPRETPAVTDFTASGAAAGGLPLVEVKRPDGTAVAQFAAYDLRFAGGVRAAVAELDGNANTVEVVTGAGPGGGPHVRVFRVNLTANNAVTVLGEFFAFDAGFTGGVRVAAGNLGGPDARDEIVVAADAGGGPHVKVFGPSGSLDAPVFRPIVGPLGSFFPFELGFAGGVRVAVGELDGNPLTGDELVVAAGPSGGPRVKVVRTDGATLADYFAFRPDFRGGVNVTLDGSIGVDRLRVDGLVTDGSQRSDRLNTLALQTPDTAARIVPLPSPAVTNLVASTSTITTGFGTLTVGGSGVTVGTGIMPTGSTTSVLGSGDLFGGFGDPGVSFPLPPLLNPPYVGRFTGLTGLGFPNPIFG